LLRAYARQLWAQIERQRPRDFSAPGVAQVAFTLLADGRLASLSLASVSGSQGLDRIALETVRAAAPFPPPPPGILADQLSFVVPFRFR
jgi:protein TonB